MVTKLLAKASGNATTINAAVQKSLTLQDLEKETSALAAAAADKLKSANMGGEMLEREQLQLRQTAATIQAEATRVQQSEAERAQQGQEAQQAEAQRQTEEQQLQAARQALQQQTL